MSGLFGGGNTAPAQKPPTPMPDEADPAVQAARRRQYELAVARSGRASTQLSDEFSNSTLGGR